ncbi:retrovirus-related pol polyprotein from transposon TNT 1-94 [Tanacetum coccineum]
MCLTSKTAGHDRPRYPVLQIRWGIIHLSNLDYAERIWEEFVQSIQTFLTDKKRLTMTSQGKKKTTPLLIPSIRLIKLIIHHLKTKHTIHLRTGSPLHYSHEDNILGNLRFVGKDGKEVFEPGVAEEEAIPETLTPKATKATKPKADMQTKPSVPQASKVTKPTGKVTKKRKPKSPLRLVDEFVDEGVPQKEPACGDEEVNLQHALELSLKDQEERTQGPARPVIFREPDFGRFQPLLERRTPMLTEPFGIAESPSLDAELAPTDSETESDEELTLVNPEKDASHRELTKINAGDQDEGQAGPNPSEQDEGQAGSNHDDAEESQPQSSHVVHAGPNLEHMDLEATDASTQQNPEQMDEEFTTTAYPNVQENLKLPTEDQVILEDPTSSTGTLSSLQNLDKEPSFTNQVLEEKPQEEEPEKSNIESEV